MSVELRDWLHRQMAAEEGLLIYASFKARNAGEPYLEIEDHIIAQHVQRIWGR